MLNFARLPIGYNQKGENVPRNTSLAVLGLVIEVHLE